MILFFSTVCSSFKRIQVCDIKIGRPKKIAGNLSDSKKIAEILRKPRKIAKIFADPEK